MIAMSKRTAVDDPLITTFGRLIEAHAHLTQQLGRSLERECGISHVWFEVLLRIARADGGQVSMSSLAQQVALTTGGVTRLLDRMIAADLVERVPCSSDRRVSFAALTGHGRQTLEAAAQWHAHELRAVFAPFSRADISTLDRLLDQLRVTRPEPDPR